MSTPTIFCCATTSAIGFESRGTVSLSASRNAFHIFTYLIQQELSSLHLCFWRQRFIRGTQSLRGNEITRSFDNGSSSANGERSKVVIRPAIKVTDLASSALFRQVGALRQSLPFKGDPEKACKSSCHMCECHFLFLFCPTFRILYKIESHSRCRTETGNVCHALTIFCCQLEQDILQSTQ